MQQSAGFLVQRFCEVLTHEGVFAALRRVNQYFCDRVNHHRHRIHLPVSTPDYSPYAPNVLSVCYSPDVGERSYYPLPMVSVNYIGDIATSQDCLLRIEETTSLLTPDDYTRYVIKYCKHGQSLFGANWKYADICTAVMAAALVLRPESYLEIGVRRGRSMAMLASVCPDCEIVGFDMWIQGYSNMENLGPAFVSSELKKVGYNATATFINGDSHKTLSDYFKANPEKYFDLITVDGDHSVYGASLDLKMTLPRLKVGGVVIFDDIVQPGLDLDRVWYKFVSSQSRFQAWEYKALGFGIGIAVRKY